MVSRKTLYGFMVKCEKSLFESFHKADISGFITTKYCTATSL